AEREVQRGQDPARVAPVAQRATEEDERHRGEERRGLRQPDPRGALAQLGHHEPREDHGLEPPGDEPARRPEQERGVGRARQGLVRHRAARCHTHGMRTPRPLGIRLVPFLLAATACASDGTPPLAGRLVDLTHPFSEETIYWPTEEGFVHEIGFRGRTERGYYYEAH